MPYYILLLGKVEVTLEQRLKSGSLELWVQVQFNFFELLSCTYMLN
ncbi:MAG: hypothetical protein ACUVRV_00265 [Cyanobacteriota bacterium]